MIPALLLFIIPLDFTARESVELIEKNHVYDYDGRLHISQVIFWNTRDVIAWRMNAEGKLNPVGKVLYFMDGGIVRCVTARTVVESWTQYDVELNQREVLKSELRAELKAKGR